MDISIQADVVCVDGTCGTTTCVIIDPIRKDITHIVVREKGFIGLEKLVPVDKILESTSNQIRLACTLNEFVLMDDFSEYKFLPGDDPYLDFDREHYYMQPYSIPDIEDEYEYASHYEKYEHIPQGELGIHGGAVVSASDGRIGQVDEFLISPEDHRISHLILRKGHLWGKKLITIPVSEIDRVESDRVILKSDRQTIEKLPTIPVRRLF